MPSAIFSSCGSPSRTAGSSGKRYLVTGGCGFIGSHLAERLIALGHAVRILDDLSTGHIGNAPVGADLLIGDVADEALVRDALRDVDGCYHLAATASVVRCNAEALASNHVNLRGTLTVLAAAARSRIPTVYASSAAVYGANPAVPLCETGDTKPLSVYAADKLACELHAAVANHLHGLPSVGLRLFNVYGPRQDPASSYSGVITIFAECLKRGRKITVFGDGNQVRDFVFVGDVVEIFIEAMAGCHSGAFVCNVCTGEGTTVLALAELLATVAGVPARIAFAPPRAGDVRMSIGDPRRLVETYARRPATPLRQGLGDLLHERASLPPHLRAGGTVAPLSVLRS
jgi:UDP-glucose 4-epimerase